MDIGLCSTKCIGLIIVALVLSVAVVDIIMNQEPLQPALRRPCPLASKIPCTPCPCTSSTQHASTKDKKDPSGKLNKPCSCQPCPNCPTFQRHAFSVVKKDISRKLVAIHLALKSAVSHKSSPSPGLLLDLEGIIGQLEPAFALSHTREKKKEDVKTSAILDVCPEEYRGEKYGYPFYHTGWVLTNCSNARPLSKVVTILLNTIDYPEEEEKQVGVVLKGINNTYPGVHTFLAPKNDHIKKIASKYQHVTVVNTSREVNSLASVWNKLVSMVTTPYVLVARDVVHFDFTARFERLIRMISDTDYVGVVGGSFRNLTGHWKVGCRQTRMMNYVLEFQEGYHHSRKSCMFCDDLEGPFISSTELLKVTRLSEKYSKEVIFEDFFIRVIRSGKLVMNCPDVMFYTTGNSSELKKKNKQVWQAFAKEWLLVRILLPGIKHAFSCQEISYKCSTLVTRHVALPKCCLEQWGRAIQFLQGYCLKNNIPFELDAGSVLAAVKFNDYSPYDADGDLILSNWNFSFIKKEMAYFKTNGFPISSFESAIFDSQGKVNKSGYFKFNSPEIYTEVWGFEMSSDKFLPRELRHMQYFTKVLVDNHWINAVFSPGLFTRNRYGSDVLKHSQHWSYVGLKSSWEHYKPGSFLKCNKPNFHSCLDKFPADGNIAFKVDD